MSGKSVALCLSSLALSLATAPVVLATGLSPAPYYTAKTVSFITNMSHHDFTAAESDFSNAMRQGIPPDKLHLLWDSIVSLNGPLEKIGAWHLVNGHGKTVETVNTEFEKGPMKLTVTFDAAGKISSYRIARAR